MARLRRTVDEVVVAAVVGVLFIALAYVEGLRVHGVDVTSSRGELHALNGAPVVLLGERAIVPR